MFIAQAHHQSTCSLQPVRLNKSFRILPSPGPVQSAHDETARKDRAQLANLSVKLKLFYARGRFVSALFHWSGCLPSAAL